MVLRGALRLGWLAPLSVGLWQIGRFMGYRPATSSQASRVVVGQPDAAGGPQYVDEARAWLYLDSGGYYALDAVCTHLGCIVNQAPAGQGALECACHGSQFDAAGRVVHGPAEKALRYLMLEWDDTGNLVIDRRQMVDPAFRLPL